MIFCSHALIGISSAIPATVEVTRLVHTSVHTLVEVGAVVHAKYTPSSQKFKPQPKWFPSIACVRPAL